MMSIESWITFVLIWILAGIPLGPNALNCIATSASVGFYRSLWCIAGILAAAFVYILVVSSGFAVILMANSNIFTVIKYLGAAYLIWMGFSMWRKKSSHIKTDIKETNNGIQLAQRAFLISMTNPKAIFAYAAIFSQFVKQDQALYSQLIILVPTAQIITALIYIAYCSLGLGVSRILGTSSRISVFYKGVGAAYIAAGMAMLGFEKDSTETSQ